eukprot:1831781-Alexandrium_andersonii.AAC.1
MRRRRPLNAQPQVLVVHGQVLTAGALPRTSARQRRPGSGGIQHASGAAPVGSDRQALPARIL